MIGVSLVPALSRKTEKPCRANSMARSRIVLSMWPSVEYVEFLRDLSRNLGYMSSRAVVTRTQKGTDARTRAPRPRVRRPLQSERRISDVAHGRHPDLPR